MSEPTFFYAPGTGVVSSRSGWGKDDTQLLVKIGPTRESHEERAIGAFAIHRGGWLTASAKLGTKSGIAQDPIDWNCVTFGTTKPSWTQDTAKLIVQENVEGSYTYLVGDLTGAYAPGGVPTVGHYTRAIFFLKPSFVLIRDEFTLLNTANTPVFHLHTLDQPTVGITGFSAVSKAAGTVLFGTAAVMCQAALPIKATPDQIPTWRLDFPADTTGGFTVALEAAPADQFVSRVTMFAPPGLRGAVLGNDMAAVVTGDLPITYRSPVAGMHYLLGLKPGVSYRLSGVTPTTASAAGVLAFHIPVVGDTITISEGNVTPPPVLTVTGYSDNPVTAGQPFTISGTGFDSDATAFWNGLDLGAIYVSSAALRAIAPSVSGPVSGRVVVASGGRSVTGPLLTVNPIPPPAGRKFELLIAPDGTPAIGKEITS